MSEIEQYANLCFAPREIATILGIAPDVFCEDYKATKEVQQAYMRGLLLTEAKVRKATIELAQGGSSAAYADYQKMVRNRDLSMQKDIN